MTLEISARSDLERVEGGQPGQWESTGHDPAFQIAFPFRRNPHVVIRLAADGDEDIDPKIYINRGPGYREKDAVTLTPGRAFTIRMDVGRYGLIRALRLDPATFPTRLTLHAAAFPTLAEADAHVASLAPAQAGALADLGRLPRFRLPVPRLPARNRAGIAGLYAEACYTLARAQPRTEMHAAEEAPWLSVVVPVYNAPARYLNDLVGSFLTQDEPGAELVLSDDASTAEETRRWFSAFKPDPRVRIVRNSENGGIARATNAGIAGASGRWVGLLDHDDLIAPQALRLIREALSANPGAMFLYTDELVVDDRLRPTGLMLKPAYDPVLLTGVNYINHFSLYRRDRLEQIGRLRAGYEGSQDYDLLLRYLAGLDEADVLHLPYPAYWWRRTGQTFSRTHIDGATAAARRAITEGFARAGTAVTVKGALTPTLHRPVFDRPAEEWPKISIILPSRDSYDLALRILGDLFNRTDYPDFEVIVVDNGTTEQRVLELYESFAARSSRFSVRIEEEPFNFARAVNKGLARASGDHVLILNNDVEVIDPSWLKEMVSCLDFPGTGIVGAKLLYPDGKIQHAGVIAGFGGLAGHWYLNKGRNYGGPMNRLHVRNSMTCVTGAVMLVSGDCMRAVGAWDEENFAVAYNDVDYCLRAHKAGFRIVWTPFACLYHHESASRGSDMTGEARRRFEREKERLRWRHATETFADPAISPAYDRAHSTPAVLVPAQLYPARRWRPRQVRET